MRILVLVSVLLSTSHASAPFGMWEGMEQVKEKFLSMSSRELKNMKLEDFQNLAIKTIAKVKQVDEADLQYPNMPTNGKKRNLARMTEKGATSLSASLVQALTSSKTASPSLAQVPESLMALSQAIQTYDSTVLDDIYVLTTRIDDDLRDHRDLYNEIVPESTRTALLQNIRDARMQVSNAENAIAAAAQTTLDGGNMVLAAFEQLPADEILDDAASEKLGGALNTLLNLISMYTSSAENAQTALRELGKGIGPLRARAIEVERAFVNAAKSGSQQLRERERRLRDEAYGSCGGICAGACAGSVFLLFLQPVVCGGCIGGCFGTAAGVIEGEKIPRLQEEYRQRGNTLDGFADLFNRLGTRLTGIESQTTADVGIVAAQQAVINGVLGVLAESAENPQFAADLKELVSSSVQEVLTGSEKIIETYKARSRLSIPIRLGVFGFLGGLGGIIPGIAGRRLLETNHVTAQEATNPFPERCTSITPSIEESTRMDAEVIGSAFARAAIITGYKQQMLDASDLEKK